MSPELAHRNVLVDRSALPEQFILCRDRDQIPEDWPRNAVQQWWLGHHPSLPVVQLSDGDGNPVGWLLGYAVDDGGTLLEGGHTATVPCATTDELEDWIYLNGGRFATIVVTPFLERVYLDPCGSLSAVYCSSLECVASTTTLVPRDGDTREIAEHMSAVGIPRDGMYPLHRTPRKNVLRLLPNHFLDLGTWEAERHWPKTSRFAVRDTADVVSSVVDRVRLNISGLMDAWPVLLRLTAGRDSRMLLACARPFADRITFFTAEHERSDERSWLDCSTGSRVAKDLGLRYVRLSHRRPRPEDLDEWLVRTGWSVGEERGWQACTTFKSLPPGHADLVGMCGELGRAEHWPEQLPAFWTPHAGQSEFGRDQLLDFFLIFYGGGRPLPHPQSRSTIAEWLESMQTYDLHLVFDLFEIEQRLGTWGGVFPYGFAHDGRFQLFPFSHRQIFEALLSLPISVRLNDDLTHLLIESEWPALLAYPFNRPRRLQRIKTAQFRALRFSGRARRAARHPMRSARRIVARIRRHVT